MAHQQPHRKLVNTSSQRRISVTVPESVAMCGQPRLVELYKMAASASGKYPFAFAIARIARQLQSASDGRRHWHDDIMPGFSRPDGD